MRWTAVAFIPALVLAGCVRFDYRWDEVRIDQEAVARADSKQPRPDRGSELTRWLRDRCELTKLRTRGRHIFLDLGNLGATLLGLGVGAISGGYALAGAIQCPDGPGCKEYAVGSVWGIGVSTLVGLSSLILANESSRAGNLLIELDRKIRVVRDQDSENLALFELCVN